MQSSTTTPSSASRRAQPQRNSRTTAPRKSGGVPQSYGKGLASPDSAFNNSHLPVTKFYPGLAAFTDAIDALPRETIRHFTLLREVDAKACGPEQQLRDFIESVSSSEPPQDPAGYDRALEHLLMVERYKRCQEDMNVMGQQPRPADLAQMNENAVPPSRRSQLQQIRWVVSDLLLTLDEKIHVISNAADALNKQLARLEDAYVVAGKEVDVICRDGNPDHWAYESPPIFAPPKGLPAAQAQHQHHQLQAAFHQPANQHHGNHASQTQAQRQAQQQAYREALAAEGTHNRSESKKESKRANAQIAAFLAKAHDNEDGTPLAHSSKKATPKPKKESDSHGAGHSGAGHHGGTGSSKASAAGGATTSGKGDAPSTKRRKLANQATSHLTNGTGTVSPRGQSPSAPVTGTTKKKASGQGTEGKSSTAKRKTIGGASSPKVAATPRRMSEDSVATGSFPAPKHPNIPGASQNVTASQPSKPKASKSKAQSSSKDDAKASRPETNVARAGDTATAAPESGHEQASAKQPPTPDVPEGSGSLWRATGSKKSAPREDRTTTVAAAAPSDTVVKSEENAPTETPQPPPPPRGHSKSGSISKASAAAAAIAAANAAAMAAAAAAAAAAKKAEEDEEPEEDDADAEGDDDDGEEERRYCYCNQISYGKMVACDGDNCKREWFHLPCVGLSHPPSSKERWYCNECSAAATKHARAHSRH